MRRKRKVIRLSRKRSARRFRSAASRVHRRNLRKTISRGGYML